MKVLLVLLVASAVGCRDHSGEAHAVGSPAPAERAAVAPVAEDPDASPSCSWVAATLVAQAAAGREVGDAAEAGIVDVCRRDAWSVATRTCVAGWRGNFLLDAAALRAACPGMVKR